MTRPASAVAASAHPSTIAPAPAGMPTNATHTNNPIGQQARTAQPSAVRARRGRAPPSAAATATRPERPRMAAPTSGRPCAAGMRTYATTIATRPRAATVIAVRVRVIGGRILRIQEVRFIEIGAGARAPACCRCLARPRRPTGGRGGGGRGDKNRLRCPGRAGRALGARRPRAGGSGPRAREGGGATLPADRDPRWRSALSPPWTPRTSPSLLPTRPLAAPVQARDHPKRGLRPWHAQGFALRRAVLPTGRRGCSPLAPGGIVGRPAAADQGLPGGVPRPRALVGFLPRARIPTCAGVHTDSPLARHGRGAVRRHAPKGGSRIVEPRQWARVGVFAADWPLAW